MGVRISPRLPLAQGQSGFPVTIGPRTRSSAYWLLPKELRDQLLQMLGDAMVLGHHVWIKCVGCSYSAVILPAVLAQLVRYDFRWVSWRGE